MNCTYSGVADILKKCNQLETLNLSWNEDWAEENFKFLITIAPKTIYHLAVRGCTQLSLSFYQTVSLYFPKLLILDVRWVEPFNYEFVDLIANSLSLMRFDLGVRSFL